VRWNSDVQECGNKLSVEVEGYVYFDVFLKLLHLKFVHYVHSVDCVYLSWSCVK